MVELKIDVAVIEVCPGGRGLELVAEAISRLYRILGESWNAVHRVGDGNAVPVDRGRIRKMILNIDTKSISLLRAELWAGVLLVVEVRFVGFTRREFY